jgi:hypothetical protein
VSSHDVASQLGLWVEPLANGVAVAVRTFGLLSKACVVTGCVWCNCIRQR